MRWSPLQIASLLLVGTTAWNTDVHNQIGFMAEQFLSPYTTSILQQILEPAYNGSIGRAAAWADAYGHTTEGRYSAQWHYIDSEDSPPSTCSLSYTHDCPAKGCVVSAIVNQTNILNECIGDVRDGLLTEGTNLTCSYALKWVTHFLGDVAQPLHASGHGAGGNLVNVTFNNQTVRLHAVWDRYIIYADANETMFSQLSIDPFFQSLVHRIRTDDFEVPKHKWLSCSDPTTPQDCALHWALESNKWNCDYVYGALRNDTDLSGDYAHNAFPIVELQISKAALRLGTWLNKLVEWTYDPDEQNEL